MTDMGIPEIERVMADELSQAIDDWDFEQQGDPFDSWGISASKAGGDCLRAIWYRLRWVLAAKKLPGRVRRILETGDIYEDRVRQRFFKTCDKVWAYDPNTHKQWKIDELYGWLRGKGDLIVRGVPGRDPEETFGVEIKSHNDKNFKRIVKSTLKSANPDHYFQIQILLWHYGLQLGIYIAINKNDESIHPEIISRDDSYIRTRLSHLHNTLVSNYAPPKISENPDFFMCRFCDFRALCQEGAMPRRRSCRNCVHSTPILGAKKPSFQCELHGMPVGPDEQKEGCDNHLLLPELVPGEQVDVSEENETITYALNSGQQWVDRSQPLGDIAND